MIKENYSFINKIRSILVSRYHFVDDVASFIACQFALESDYGKSFIAKHDNNYSGMKVPRVRISVALNFNSNSSFAQYNSLDDCIYDYILWLQYQRPTRHELETIHLLFGYFRIYCPEKDYIDRINSIYKQFKNYNHE